MDPIIDDRPATGPRRFPSGRSGETFVRIFQGEYYVTNRSDEILSTVLGSCVAVCIRDPRIGYGGMNHFLLPSAAASMPQDFSLRYGVYSVERLINDILGHGGERNRLEVKVFGGANVLAGMARIGTRNAEFVEEYLEREGLPIAAKHLRGNIARRIRYYPKTGRVLMSQISKDIASIGQQEIKLLDKDLLEPTAGTTELFKRRSK